MRPGLTGLAIGDPLHFVRTAIAGVYDQLLSKIFERRNVTKTQAQRHCVPVRLSQRAGPATPGSSRAAHSIVSGLRAWFAFQYQGYKQCNTTETGSPTKNIQSNQDRIGIPEKVVDTHVQIKEIDENYRNARDSAHDTLLQLFPPDRL
jgi:hypothetical protein